MEAVEVRILSQANAGQTVSNTNTINGAHHRFVGTGTANSSAALALTDLSAARLALVKANVPLNGLCAIIDPTTAYVLETQTNAVNILSPQPMWGDMVKEGAITGFKFRYNILGFDFYVSNYLPSVGSETVNSVSVTNGVANYFFSSAGGDLTPFIGGFRQMPTVYSEFNKDLQQEEYLTIAEYGFKLYRPENLVTILTSTSVVTQ
jgi:hypothetical protein